MGKIIETTINEFNGGIANDPRDERENTCRAVSNFNILQDKKRMIPYRDSEDGDSASATSQKQNFAIALRTGTTYNLYALGVKTGTGIAEVLYKDLSTGGVADLGDDGWNTPANNQSASGATSFNLFVYYAKTGLIYGARAGTHIWAFSPTGSAWADTSHALAYTNIAQGLVHSKDDILYIPYDNKIAKNDNGAWTDAALTLPTHLKVNSISEYGNYLAIACAPLSGLGNSVVYLWDRDSTLTTLSESIDWGEGVLKVISEIDGILVGISAVGGTSFQLDDRVVFRFLSGNKAFVFEELVGSIGTVGNSFPIAKQKVNNRLFFMLAITISGAVREGVWSVGRATPSSGFSVIHERTPNNDTALSSGTLANFIFVGDFLFTAYNSSSAWALSKTNDQDSYTASSIYEKRFNTEGSSKKKDLIGITVETEFLPTAGQVILEYRTDENTSWTNIFTNTTNNSISQSANNSMPKDYKEIEFRIDGTGGAVIIGLNFKEEITNKKSY